MTTMMAVKRKYVVIYVSDGGFGKTVCLPADEVQDAVKAYRQNGLVVEFV